MIYQLRDESIQFRLDCMNKWFGLVVCIMISLQGAGKYDDATMSRLWHDQQVLFDRVMAYDALHKKADKKYQYYVWKNAKIDQELLLYEQFEKVHQRPHNNKDLLIAVHDSFAHKINKYDERKNKIQQRRALALASMNSYFLTRRNFLLDFHDDEKPYDFGKEEQTFLFNRSLHAVMRREKKLSGLVLTFDLYAS